MSARLLLLFVFLLAGCVSPITSLEEFGYDLNVDEILRTHFTDEAYEAVRDIPTVDGFTSLGGGYAAGVNSWSTFASLITFNGYGRKVIVNVDKLIENAKASHIEDEVFIQRYIIHEYIHHLDDMTRDGDADFIDLEEFANGLYDCYGHMQYHGLWKVVHRQASRYFMETFGIGELGEHVAYAGDMIAFQNCPKSLGYAFRRILRKYE